MQDPLSVFPDAGSEYAAHLLLYDDYAKRQTAAVGECRRQIMSIRTWVEDTIKTEVDL